MVSPLDGPSEFYQGSERRVIGAKCVLDPADAVHPLTLDSDDIKAHKEIRKSLFATDEPCGRADDLALFPTVDRKTRCGILNRTPVPYLYECEALPIKHDQVDFPTATAKVTRDRSQPMPQQVAIRDVFRAYA